MAVKQLFIETGVFEFEGERLPYRLSYSRRRTLAIHVFADGRIELRVPLGCTRAQAEAFLRERGDWVRRKQRELSQRPPPPLPEYAEGSLQPYLGRHYALRLERRRPERVDLRGDLLWVRSEAERVEPLLRRWYRRCAGVVFQARLRACYEQAALPDVPFPELGIRVMRSRWGSCSSRGRVNLNLELIKYPIELIDYVIVHELCHFLEFNHSPRFYAHMERLMPDWPQRRRRLNELSKEIAPFPARS